VKDLIKGRKVSSLADEVYNIGGEKFGCLIVPTINFSYRVGWGNFNVSILIVK
jgi:hypothetical protein